MGRVTTITCDKCKKEISPDKSYTTITLRRYSEGKKVKDMPPLRLPTLWICDKCYKALGMYMSFPPFDILQQEEDGE